MNKTEYYIVSIRHTRSDEPYITLWRPDNRGYCWFKSNAGVYEEVEDGYHNVDGNDIPISTEMAEQLFTKVNYEGREQMAIPNTKQNLSIIKAQRYD